VTILVSYHGFLYDFSLLILPVMVVVNYIGAHSHDGKVLQFRLLMPMLVLFLTPLYVLLWYRCGLSTLMAFAPLGWALAISRELSQCRVSQHAKVAST
jgi:hypothetical protein